MIHKNLYFHKLSHIILNNSGSLLVTAEEELLGGYCTVEFWWSVGDGEDESEEFAGWNRRSLYLGNCNHSAWADVPLEVAVREPC
jgi:hypothetical protein